MPIETIHAEINLCGEAPIWDRERERLIWSDCGASRIFEYSPKVDRSKIIGEGKMAGGIALSNDGRLILSGSNGIAVWNELNDAVTVASQFDGRPLCCNDSIADHAGRLYFGTYYWGEHGMIEPGALYLLHTDGTITVVDDGIELANGLAFSPDNDTLYFSDSTARKIYAYNVDRSTGNLHGKRTFVDVPNTSGIPDGLTVDADGYVWSAQWYSGEVIRYDPDGTVERKVAIPALQVSSIAFGGTDLTDIFITSAAEPWPSPYVPAGYKTDAANIGGSLYRMRLDIQGKSEHRARISALPERR